MADKNPKKTKAKVKSTTPDSTHYYKQKAYEAGLRYSLASGLPEMKRQEQIQKQSLANAERQKYKGRPGYDENGNRVPLMPKRTPPMSSVRAAKKSPKPKPKRSTKK
jgi:hypothetical protein